MSNNSYITFYQNEVRAVEITINDQDDVAWTPSTAYMTVVDNDGDVIVSEAVVLVSANTVVGLIDTRTTETPGDYYLIWRILQTVGASTYTYYHKTALVVEAL